MMKTTIPTILAFSSMMGSTNAIALESYLAPEQVQTLAQTGDDEGCNSTAAQERELINQFNERKGSHERLSFAAFATLLDAFALDPPNRDCSDQNDSQFYETYMGSGCTDERPNYSIPEIVKCYGFTQFCADAGKLRHFSAVRPDGSGKEDESLSAQQFSQAIASLNDELTGGDGTCLVYNIITDPGIVSDGVASIIYEYVQTFADSGDGAGGYRDQEVTVKAGRSSEREISHEVTTSASAHQNWLLPIGSGGAELHAGYDFAATFASATSLETETKTTLHLDFSAPNYVYDQKVTIVYNDARFVTIYGGTFISHREGGEAFRREVVLDAQGNVDHENILACAACGPAN
jgi:hypothetical protein